MENFKYKIVAITKFRIIHFIKELYRVGGLLIASSADSITAV